MPVFCCNCRDGPYNTAVVTSCTNCNHYLCNGCPSATEYYNYSTAAQASDPHYHAATSATHSSTARLSGSHQDVPTANLNTRFPAGDGGRYTEYHHKPVLRWQCCSCYGNNSVATDLGCAFCNNHNKCGYCKVWDDARQ